MKYDVQFAGPKRRVRRDWRGTVLTGLTLLTLAALCGWLWSCVRHSAGHGAWGMEPASSFILQPLSFPLALAPVTKGAMMGLLLFFSVALIVLAVRKVEENERWCEGLRRRELERRQRLDAAARFWDEKTGEEKGWEDEVDVRSEKVEDRVEGREIAPEDLRRIVGALIVETCSARDYVRKAQGDLSVEDYGAKLTAAEASLHLVIGCLGGLLERTSEMMKDEGGMMKDEGRAES